PSRSDIGPGGCGMTASIRDLLSAASARGASDVHLTAGAVPKMRLHGRVLPLVEGDVLSPRDMFALVSSVLTESQAATFLHGDQKELDFSFDLEGVGRCRVDVHREQQGVGAAIRLIPARIPTFEELGLAPGVGLLAVRPQGLVLVVGTTGSGRSTTLAAIID